MLVLRFLILCDCCQCFVCLFLCFINFFKICCLVNLFFRFTHTLHLFLISTFFFLVSDSSFFFYSFCFQKVISLFFFFCLRYVLLAQSERDWKRRLIEESYDCTGCAGILFLNVVYFAKHALKQFIVTTCFVYSCCRFLLLE